MPGASAVVPSAQLSPRSAARSTVKSLRGRPRKSKTPDAIDIQGFSLTHRPNVFESKMSCIKKLGALAIASEPGERTYLDLPLPQIRSCPPLESSA